MAAAPPRIKLLFEDVLAQQLAEKSLQKFWYQLPDISATGCRLQKVSDFIAVLCEALELSPSSNLQLQLDGYSILSNSPLTLFRDGDTITVSAQPTAAALSEPQATLAVSNKRQRSKSPLALTATEDDQAPKALVKRRKTTAATPTANSSPAAVAVQTSPQPADVSATEKAGNGDTHRKAPKRKRGHDTTASAAGVSKEAKHPSQSMTGDAPTTAGDASILAADAAGQAPNALSPDGAAPAASAGTLAEGQKQSRSARRKQLKRRYKRLGVAPPQSSADPHAPVASITSALAAAADASPFDPNSLQPHQGNFAAPVTDFVTKPPPAKRLRTQAAVSQPLKAQSISKGHVYFENSSSESDEDHQGGSSVAAADQTGDHAQTAQNGPQATQSLAHPRSALAEAKQVARSSAQQEGDTAADNRQQADQAPNNKKLSAETSKPKPSNESQPQDDSEQGGAGPSMPELDPSRGRAGHSLPLPKSDAEYAALPRVGGQPQQGDLVAYRLLEIGADWAPQVSEWRQGAVAEVEADAVIIKPLPGQGSLEQPSSQANGHAQQEENVEAAGEDEDEEEEEGPPSAYDSDGVLTADLSALSELRLIKASTAMMQTLHANGHCGAKTSGKSNDGCLANATDAGKAGVGTAATGTAAQTDTQSKAGQAVALDVSAAGAAAAPAQAETADATAASEAAEGRGEEAGAGRGRVPKVGAWAELQAQLTKRKAQLAEEAGTVTGHTSTAKGTGLPVSAHGAQQQQQQAVSDRGKGIGAGAGMHVPGAVRPRGGVRASAMGPMLAFLRSSGGLDQSHEPN